MIKVLSIIGTRPELIKMAPVLHELAAHPHLFESKVCVTAQHREMVDQMLALFGVVPDYDLDVMRPGQSLADITCAVLHGLEPVLREERPDWLLVQGDTTTVAAASLAGFYNHVRVGHVEAGLRTFDKRSPFPEEGNRRLAGVLADLHFAPTAWAADNLRREGVPEHTIRMTGNTVIDAFKHVSTLPFSPALERHPAMPENGKKIVVVTAHRGENVGDGIERICGGIRALLEDHDDMHVVFPVHLNPRIREPVFRLLADSPSVTLLDPLDYHSLVWLLDRCHFLITDSGGLQEEATAVGKPVLVLRDSTERPEGVKAGTARLIGSDGQLLRVWGSRLLRDEATYERMARASSPYGHGQAARAIVDSLRGFPVTKQIPANELELEPVVEETLIEGPVEEPAWMRGALTRRFARRGRRAVQQDDGVAA